MHQHSDALSLEIAVKAQELRIEVLKMVFGAQTGHLGGSYSAAEIVASLFFHQLRLDPARPDWPERDRFILSKGHAAPILYATLAHRGFIPMEARNAHPTPTSAKTTLDARAKPGPPRAALGLIHS